MKALSIRQPWAWLILHAGKDIENRSRRFLYRGRILIHASREMSRREYAEACAFVAKIKPDLVVPRFESLPRGGIVGAVNLAGCVARSDSPWFVGPEGLVLSDPQELSFWQCPGQLGLFECHYPLAA